MRCYMRDPNGCLIEVGQTTMTAGPLDLCTSRTAELGLPRPFGDPVHIIQINHEVWKDRKLLRGAASRKKVPEPAGSHIG